MQHCFQRNHTWHTFNHRFVWEGVNHSNEFDGQLGKARLTNAKPHSLVGSVLDLRTRGCWFDSLALPIFFPWIDDSYWNMMHSSLTRILCGVLVKGTPKKHGLVHWLPQYY